MRPMTAMLRVLAWTALADGDVDPGERAMLDALATAPGEVDAVLDSLAAEAPRDPDDAAAISSTAARLCADLSRYGDRALVALRARACVLSDGRLTAAERRALLVLDAALGLTRDDAAAVERLAADIARGEPCPPDDRALRWLADSSFARRSDDGDEGDEGVPPC